MKNLTNKIRSKMFDTRKIMYLISDEVWQILWAHVWSPVALQTNARIWDTLHDQIKEEVNEEFN